MTKDETKALAEHLTEELVKMIYETLEDFKAGKFDHKRA